METFIWTMVRNQTRLDPGRCRDTAWRHHHMQQFLNPSSHLEGKVVTMETETGGSRRGGCQPCLSLCLQTWCRFSSTALSDPVSHPVAQRVYGLKMWLETSLNWCVQTNGDGGSHGFSPTFLLGTALPPLPPRFIYSGSDDQLPLSGPVLVSQV